MVLYDNQIEGNTITLCIQRFRNLSGSGHVPFLPLASMSSMSSFCTFVHYRH